MSALHYRVSAPDPRNHLFRVALTLPRPVAGQVLALPVWIPGSYLVREFAQHLQELQAHQGGQPVALLQLDKHRWQVDVLPSGSDCPLELEWAVYALDASVRTAWLDPERGFFNGTSLCLRVVGLEHLPHRLTIEPPPAHPDWQLATALEPEHTQPSGFGTYNAAHYAELVDTPVEMGRFWSGRFEVRGVPHRLVVGGAAGSFDGERLLADTRRICEAEMAFWHGEQGPPPFSRYLFMLQATHDGYGGLEHHNSTALICPRADLPPCTQPDQATAPLKATDGYTGLLGLISHEYFHSWNVKRLRPAEFATLDLDRENHTRLLWFFEGFTSYFDDLLLVRAGLIDPQTHLQLLAKTLNQVAQTPGQRVQSVAQASFDAWTRYYRVQENTPNATVSYYTKGALVALCLDLSLRQLGHTLDEVMRALWHHCQGGPMTEADLRMVLHTVSGRSFDAELDAWVHGTADLPALDLLAAQGVSVQHEPAPLAQRLGLRVSETGTALVLKNVLRGGVAEAAGMASGDEWLGVEFSPGELWRIQRLDDIPPLLGTRSTLHAWVSRDRRMLRLPLAWPAAPQSARVCKLGPGTATAADATLRWPLA